MVTRRTALSFLSSLPLARAMPARAADAERLPGPPLPPPAYFQKHLAPAEADFFVVLADRRERGERMVVRGAVTDGAAPVKGASVYAYHADADGRYDPLEPRPGEGADNARLAGYMRTDAAGRYVFESVRPAPYPGTTLPAHIHYVVSADGFRSRFFEIWFEGDPMITADHLAARARRPDYWYIRPAVRTASRAWQVTHDIVLERL